LKVEISSFKILFLKFKFFFVFDENIVHNFKLKKRYEPLFRPNIIILNITENDYIEKMILLKDLKFRSKKYFVEPSK